MCATDRDFLADEISVDESFIGACINEYICAVNTIYRSYCRSCTECQKSSKRKHHLCCFLSLTCRSSVLPWTLLALFPAAPRENDTFSSYATMQHATLRLRSIEANRIASELSSPESACQMKSSLTKGQTTPYRPQTDGLVERFNHILKSMLRKTATSEGKNWTSPTSFLRIVRFPKPLQDSPPLSSFMADRSGTPQHTPKCMGSEPTILRHAHAGTPLQTSRPRCTQAQQSPRSTENLV